MRKKNWKLAIIQAILIVIISVASSFSLPITGVWAILVSAGLAAVGIVTIFYPRLGPELFSVLATVISLPAILMHSTVDWWSFKLAPSLYEVIGGGLLRTRLYVAIAPEFTFALALGLGLLLVAGYLALSYLHSLQKNYRTLTAGQAEIAEVNEVTNRSFIPVVRALIGSAALAVVVAVLLWVIKMVATNYLAEMSWNIIFIGLAAVLVLAGFLYWVGVRRRWESSNRQ